MPPKHPRRGGEDAVVSQHSIWIRETPPPRRGRRTPRNHACEPHGNTPAEAGKTRVGSEAVRLLQKHPRRGGEDSRSRFGARSGRETPPPRRGRLSVRDLRAANTGNTPAEAGKTATYGSCLLKEYYKLLKNKIIG